MRILAVVYCFPPLLVPAALCYLKLVLGLRQNGVEVEILEIDPRSFLPPGPVLLDPAINRKVPADLVRHAVWSPERSPLVRLGKRLLRSTALGMRYYEPKKREWVAPALRRLRRLDLGRYDAVLTCSQLHVNHLIGLRLKATTRLPWVAYFSDPWARNPYARFANPRVAAYHRALETQVLRAADRVLYTCDEMLHLAEEDQAAVLQGKAGVLPHSYVPEWFGPPVTEPSPALPIRLLHTGHFYGPRSPAPLLRALHRLHQRRDLTGRLRIDSYGSFPAADREALVRNGLGEIVRIHDTVPYLDSLALMRRQDLLLTIDAKLTQMSESVFLPSKLVDYLGAGKPLLAVTPSRGASARVVREVGGVVCDVADEAEIEAALERLLDEGPPPPPAAAAVQPYHYREVGAQLVAMLKEITG
jgi:glycosyltransferase involved in cell wall biosynthesis